MSQDDLLGQLGRVARDRQDAQVDDGAEPGSLVDPALQRAVRPPDEARRLAARALARAALKRPAPVWDEEPVAPTWVEPEVVPDVAPANQPLPRAGRWRWASGLAAGLAVAAGLLLWAGPGGEGQRATWTVTEVKAAAATRGAVESIRLVAGDTVRMVLQPDHAVGGALGAQVVLVSPSAELPLVAEVETSTSGSLRLRAALPAELPGEVRELRVVVLGADGGALQVIELPVVR